MASFHQNLVDFVIVECEVLQEAVPGSVEDRFEVFVLGLAGSIGYDVIKEEVENGGVVKTLFFSNNYNER